MQGRRGGNRSKDMYGSGIRRSEYDDALMRNNIRSSNRLRSEMHYYDRAQKVIMKDLGKESLLLKTKLENDKRTISLGLYGSKFGTTSPVGRKSSPTKSKVPNGKLKPLYPSFLQKADDTDKSSATNIRWNKEPSDVDSAFDKESVYSAQTSPMRMSKNTARFKTPTSLRYPSSRAQRDDFLASILNDADDDYPEINHAERSSGLGSPRKPDTGMSKGQSARGKVTPVSMTGANGDVDTDNVL